jgi:hypothetical protein
MLGNWLLNAFVEEVTDEEETSRSQHDLITLSSAHLKSSQLGDLSQSRYFASLVIQMFTFSPQLKEEVFVSYIRLLIRSLFSS